MTQVTASPQTHAGHAGTSSWSFAGLIKSEWIKFWSLRSTIWLLIITLVTAVGVAALTAALRHQIYAPIATAPGEPGAPVMTNQEAVGTGLELYNLPSSGLTLALLVIGALAVIFMAGEYGTGMIRSTMSATPKRLPVFFAKAIIMVVVSYVVSTIAAFLSYLIAIGIFSDRADLHVNWQLDGAIQSLFLGGVFVAGAAVAGLAIGTLLRSPAGSITVFIALFFALDFAGSFLGLVPGDFWKYVPQYLPSAVGGRMLAIDETSGLIPPTLAGFLYLGWITVLTVPALISLKIRDV